MSLLKEVQTGLAKRNRDEWKRCAAQVDGVSIAWVEQMGRGVYKNSPAYARLEAVAKWLRNNPRRNPSVRQRGGLPRN